MSLRNISSVLIGIIISNMFLSYNTNAGLVPGTINKATYTSSIQCQQENKKYSPTGGSCESYCASGHYEDIFEEQCTPNPDNCEEVCELSGGIGTCYQNGIEVAFGVEAYECRGRDQTWVEDQRCFNQCTPVADTCVDVDTGRNTYVCDVTSTRPVMTGELNFIDYSDNSANPTYSIPSGTRKLGIDSSVTCNHSAKGTGHIDPNKDGEVACLDGTQYYYTGGGADGKCDEYKSTDNLLENVDQITGGNRVPGITEDDDNICTIEGRYAQIDDTKPTIIVDNLGSIKTGSDQWCNLDKYASRGIFSGIPYGSGSNIKTSGCDYYDQTGGDDLVDAFSVTIQDNLSGLAEVKIELGTCGATYDFTGNLSDLINSTSSPSGVKSGYLSPITFSTETSTTYAGKGIKSLKEAFGLTGVNDKLHDCLAEGENYLKIAVKDAARSDLNGVTQASNEAEYSSLDSGKAIRVDNSQPAFKINSADNPGSSWYDHSVEGTVTITDNESGGTMCTAYQVTGTGTCTGKPADSNWLSPVNSNGTYDIYSCDSMQITTSSVCIWSCTAPYVLSADGTTCENNPDPYSWNLSGSYDTCDGGLQYKTVTCDNSAGPGDTSSCLEADLTSQLTPEETIFIKDSGSYTLERSCTVPTSCFTLGEAILGEASATLCSN